ncbi:TPA: hypothetical protein ACGOVE_002008, partial [Streptococcus suis]
LLSLTVSSLLSNEITGLLKDSKTNIFKQGEVANFIIELSVDLCLQSIQPSKENIIQKGM